MIFVSDHCVVRFLERFHGLDLDYARRATTSDGDLLRAIAQQENLDVEAIRSRIASSVSPKALAVIQAVGAEVNVKLGNGLMLCLKPITKAAKDFVATTSIVPEPQRPCPTDRPERCPDTKDFEDWLSEGAP